MTPRERVIYDQGIDAAAQKLTKLRQSYSETIFFPIPVQVWPWIRRALESVGIKTDALSAQYYRDIIDVCLDEVDKAKDGEPF